MLTQSHNLPGSGHPSKFSPRSVHAMFRETAATPQTLQTSVRMLNLKIHDTAIRKGFACLETLPGGRLFSLKRTAQFRFAMFNMNIPQDLWSNVLWTEEIKVEMFDCNAQLHMW